MDARGILDVTSKCGIQADVPLFVTLPRLQFPPAARSAIRELQMDDFKKQISV